jgi:type IV secretory pathway TrbD component
MIAAILGTLAAVVIFVGLICIACGVILWAADCIDAERGGEI